MTSEGLFCIPGPAIFARGRDAGGYRRKCHLCKVSGELYVGARKTYGVPDSLDRSLYVFPWTIPGRVIILLKFIVEITNTVDVFIPK